MIKKRSFIYKLLTLCLVMMSLCVSLPALAAEIILPTTELQPEELSAEKPPLPQKWEAVGVCGVTSTERKYMDSFNKFDGAIQPGFTNRLVTCVQSLLKRVVDNELTTIQQSFSKFMTAMLTLLVIMFGIRMAMGQVRDLQGDFAKMVITVCTVVYLLNGGLSTYIKLLMDVQEAFVAIVIKPINTQTDGSGKALMCSEYFNAWQKIDCVIFSYMGANPEDFQGSGKIYAIDAPNQTGVDTLTLAPFIIFIGLLFTGVGPYVLLLGLLVPILMVAAIAQAIFIYISSLIIIVFLAVIAPLVIPMILFRQTKQIFTVWLEALFAYTLQPAIVMAYITFMVSILGYVFNPNPTADKKCDPDHPNSLQCFYQQVMPKDDREARAGIKEVVKGILSTSQAQEKVADTEFDPSKTTETSRQGMSAGALWLPNINLHRFAGINSASKLIAKYDTNNNGKIDAGTDEQENFDKEGLEASEAFVQALFVAVLILLMMFSFLVNVMNFGAGMAGLAATPIANGANIFNLASGGLGKVLK